MREIKCRAVIRGDAGVYDVWIIDNLYQKALVQRNCGDEWVEYKKIKYLWQFTGLKDKYSKEIYEGDIWKLGDVFYKIVFVCTDFNTGIKKRAGDNYTDIGHQNSIRGEIIGNIHENPELLEE